MIDDETRRKLREMGLAEMVEAPGPREADRTCMSVPFDERVRMMAGRAYEEKRAASVKRLTQRARLRFPDAEPGEMIYEGRGIDGVLVREAITCQFMFRAANVVIEGCTGVFSQVSLAEKSAPFFRVSARKFFGFRRRHAPSFLTCRA